MKKSMKKKPKTRLCVLHVVYRESHKDLSEEMIRQMADYLLDSYDFLKITDEEFATLVNRIRSRKIFSKMIDEDKFREKFGEDDGEDFL